jgi:hypothetical protein
MCEIGVTTIKVLHPGTTLSTNRSFVERSVAASIGAASEVMFPANDHGAPDWKQTDMVERTMDYLTELPPHMRHLVMFMFLAIEFLCPFLLVGPGRFSRQPAARRLRGLLRWRSSRFILYFLLCDALKAQLCMMYMSHPAVQRYMQAWKSCERENDPLGLPVRENVFSATTANGLVEGI